MAVDPIDGTTNFVNGFPIFSASIGVLHRGRPIVGALWCSISHALRAGTYHASRGGKLRFDGADVTPKVNPHVRLRVSQNGRLNARWSHVAGGIMLVEAADGVVRQSSDGKNWTPMNRFETAKGSAGEADLHHWRRSISVGNAQDVARMCGL